MVLELFCAAVVGCLSALAFKNKQVKEAEEQEEKRRALLTPDQVFREHQELRERVLDLRTRSLWDIGDKFGPYSQTLRQDQWEFMIMQSDDTQSFRQERITYILTDAANLWQKLSIPAALQIQKQARGYIIRKRAVVAKLAKERIEAQPNWLVSDYDSVLNRPDVQRAVCEKAERHAHRKMGLWLHWRYLDCNELEADYKQRKNAIIEADKLAEEYLNPPETAFVETASHEMEWKAAEEKLKASYISWQTTITSSFDAAVKASGSRQERIEAGLPVFGGNNSMSQRQRQERIESGLPVFGG